jgi:polysaccharide export outer membrane protein
MPSIHFCRRALAVAFLLVLTSACAGTTAPPGTAAYQPTVYRLAAGDKLSITVFGEESLSREFSVTPQGDLAFPLLGDIPVSNMTVSELQEMLRTRLADGYVNDPRVTVEVLNYRPFYILGEVNKAGEYPFSDGLTAIQAVARAGGYSYRADQSTIYIIRSGQQSEERYDLRDGRPVYVSPGDTIRVGERYF